MADSRRVFVQLAGVRGSRVEVGAAVMAFVLPTDSWLSVVNEFLMVGACIASSPLDCSH